MEPKYHWFCVYLWWFTPGCLPDTGEKGKAERRRSGNLTYIFIFKPLIRSIGLHHGKIPSLKLLAVLLRESEDQENTTDWERGFKKFLNLQDSPLHNKGSTISLYLLNLTISLWNSIFFFFIACRVSNSGGVKFVPCFKNNIPKQTWWIRGDISF